jgi:chromosome segregation ATPase
LDDGKQAFEPAPKSNKRKNTKPHAVRKKRQKDGNDSDDDFIVSDDEDAATESEDDSDDEDIQAPCKELNIQDVKAKLKELRESRKMARREVSEYKTKIEELRPRTRELKEKIAEIKADISHKCIAGRNDYSRRAIQPDFAAGIKELDQENAAEEDEDNFNPDEELRDYGKDEWPTHEGRRRSRFQISRRN